MNKINEIGEAYILLHMDCELRCKVCPYLGEQGACKDDFFSQKYGGGKKLDISRLKRFVDELLPYKPKVITLSGGEPLNYEKWEELAKYIKSKGIQVAISTNGLRIQENLESLFFYVDSINLNPGGRAIETVGPSHESGNSNIFLEGIVKIINLKKKYGKKTPVLKFIYIITDFSYEHMRKFYDFFNRHEIAIDEFLFQHMMYITNEKLEKQNNLWKKLGFSTALWKGFNVNMGKIDFDLLLKQIKYLEKKGNVRFSPLMTSEEISMYYDPYRKDKIKRNIKCLAPWNQYTFIQTVI